MARVLVIAESGTRKIKDAVVTAYTEDATIGVGQEDSFSDGAKATIYSDVDMTVAETNPVNTDSNGEAEFYMPSMSQIAIKISRAGYGTRWHRFVDVTGSDPV